MSAKRQKLCDTFSEQPETEDDVKLEFNNGLFNSVTVEANRLVIKDNFGQPILLAIEYDNNTIAVYKAQPGENAEFKKLLRSFGIEQTNDVKEIQI